MSEFLTYNSANTYNSDLEYNAKATPSLYEWYVGSQAVYQVYQGSILVYENSNA